MQLEFGDKYTSMQMTPQRHYRWMPEQWWAKLEENGTIYIQHYKTSQCMASSKSDQVWKNTEIHG